MQYTLATVAHWKGGGDGHGPLKMRACGGGCSKRRGAALIDVRVQGKVWQGSVAASIDGLVLERKEECGRRVLGAT